METCVAGEIIFTRVQGFGGSRHFGVSSPLFSRPQNFARADDPPAAEAAIIEMKQTGFCQLRGSSFPYLVLPPVACWQASGEEGKGAKRRDKIRGFFPPLSFPIRACHAGYSQPTPIPLSAFSPDSLTTRQSATPRRIGPNCKQLKIIKGIPPNN